MADVIRRGRPVTEGGVSIHIHIGDDAAPARTATENARSRADSRIAPDGRIPKGEANYRTAFGPENCGQCKHGAFEPGAAKGGCTVVTGDVGATMVCDNYLDPENKPKKGRSIWT